VDADLMNVKTEIDRIVKRLETEGKTVTFGADFDGSANDDPITRRRWLMAYAQNHWGIQPRAMREVAR
jgi:hypothetical protein